LFNNTLDACCPELPLYTNSGKEVPASRSDFCQLEQSMKAMIEDHLKKIGPRVLVLGNQLWGCFHLICTNGAQVGR
jgi:hypothetical protein